MSIADKLLVVADNIPKVYEAGQKAGGDYDTAYNEGYNNGYAKGETDGYNNGYTDGVASVPNPLEYANSLGSTYLKATFPENYEMTINIPLVTSMNACFQGATGITKLTIKGNVAGNVIGMTGAFRVPTLEILDLSEFNAIVAADGKHIFNGATVLKEVKGTLDFTNATQLNGAFNICYELKEVRFKENSIFVSISLANSSKLSTASVQSIFDGLATVEIAQTITLHKDVKILQAQVDSANAKGWTVAGGTVVSEEEYYG